jgi:D-alanyl-D-alanine carboxypeptidase/D-alanyl-D-alanine-endopeptidase (penicillin-binding protein 4)
MASWSWVVRLWAVVVFSVANCPAQGRAAIAALVGEAERLSVRTGVLALDARGGELYRHRADEPFVPASNLKLLTGLAVLDSLGADYRFQTLFSLRDGVLVVTSGGDPNLHTGSPYAAQAAFDALTAELRRRGVLAVRDLRLDAASFVGPDRPADWPADQLHLDYCAPTSPFLLDAALYRVRLEPDVDGEAPRARVIAPWDGVRVRNDLKRAAARQAPVYGAMNQGDLVIVHGRHGRLANPYEFTAVMQEPRRWFEGLLRWRLQAGGIAVSPAAAPVADQEVLSWRSPLQPALQRVLEDSSNVDAEQCLRVLGAERLGDGSLAGGVRALQGHVEQRLARWSGGLVLRDGSGLSAGNRVTPQLLAGAMQSCGAAAKDGLFYDCLPVAGATGTLADRFVGSALQGRVRAKTGWIRGASALSGFVELDGGGPRYFAILMNYDPDRGGLNKELKVLQERLVAAIAALEVER